MFYYLLKNDMFMHERVNFSKRLLSKDILQECKHSAQTQNEVEEEKKQIA